MNETLLRTLKTACSEAEILDALARLVYKVHGDGEPEIPTVEALAGVAVFGWQPSEGARFELWDRGDPGDKLTLDGKDLDAAEVRAALNSLSRAVHQRPCPSGPDRMSVLTKTRNQLCLLQEPSSPIHGTTILTRNGLPT